MSRPKTLIVASIFFIASLFVAVMSVSGAGSMSIKRIEDPVTAQGKDLKFFIGKPIKNLRLMVFSNGQFVPAPYQIDERHPSGEWVFPVGETPEADVDAGMLDANDELVFMAKDAGAEAPAGKKPDGAKDGMKLTLNDPLDGGTGYAYLFFFDNPPAPSKVDYASYKVEEQWMWMIGTSYKIGTGINETYFDKLLLKMPDGSWSPDMLDRYKTRGRGINLPGMDEIPEERAKARAIGWRDGPVRVIRKTIGWLKVAWKIKFQGEGSSQNIYYANYFMVPLKLQIPSVPKTLIKNFHLTTTLDFSKRFYGAKYYDAVNGAGMTFDGKMSDAENKMDLKKPRTWYCVTGDKGSVFVRYVFPKVMTQGISLEGYYVDDAAAPDIPEEEPGQSNVGLWMRNIGLLPPGNYSYDGYFIFPENFKWGQQTRFQNMIDSPIKVKVDVL